jgi:hypothetical protein
VVFHVVLLYTAVLLGSYKFLLFKNLSVKFADDVHKYNSLQNVNSCYLL